MSRLLIACTLLLAVACGRAASVTPIEAHGAWTRPADSATVMAAYLVVVNHEKAPVSLNSASSPLAESVTLHETMQMGGMVHMMALDSVQVIAAGDSLVLTEGGKHFMVSGLRRALAAGDSLPIALTFGDQRVVHVMAAVRAP
jgi:copper(I)-binding protein